MSQGPPRPISRAYGWYVVAVLFFLHLSAAVDRFIVGVVVIPLKDDFLLTDAKIGLLQGLAFALLYCTAGIPLGRLADTVSRRGLLFFACLAWAASTAGSAIATSFDQLFAARLATGLAEAALVPASLALITAYIPRASLGLATSVFMVGASLGKAVAFTVGGAALSILEARNGLQIGALAFKPWQGLFLLAALPAVLAAAALLTIREPERTASSPRGSWSQILKYLGQHRATFAAFALMGVSVVLIAHIFAAWAPSFFSRRFGLSAGDASVIVGLTVVIAGPAGGILGGWITDSLSRRGERAGAPLVIAGTHMIAVPTTVVLVLTDNLPLAVGAYCVAQAAAVAGGTQSYAGILLLTPPAHRGLTTAIYMTVSTLAALVVGPLAVGIFSDHIFTDPVLGLGFSMLTVLTLFAAVGLAAWPRAARGFREIAVEDEPVRLADKARRDGHSHRSPMTCDLSSGQPPFNPATQGGTSVKTAS